MTDRIRHRLRLGVAAALVITVIGTTACGTVLYPERRGQAAGRIDPAVAVLDGIGLLFFVVPGVIAFAVDFATGTIYLPGTASNTTLDMDDADVVRLDPDTVDVKAIERRLAQATGRDIDLADPALQARRPDDAEWRSLAALVSAPEYAALTGRRMQAAR